METAKSVICSISSLFSFLGLSHVMNGVALLMNSLLNVRIYSLDSGKLHFNLWTLTGIFLLVQRRRIRDNLKLGEENFRVIGEKRKMEEELRFFKLDFAKMVADKEEAVNYLGNARLALSDLKEEIEKKKLADHGCTNLHQVLRAKPEKERDHLVLERDQVKQEKKKLEYIISDLMK
ncbi:putative CBL-interacting protein kinase 13 [Hordeum vulgare]|nr:putative CBL-interacting protein kinase 13 [Hordeum vulgare]